MRTLDLLECAEFLKVDRTTAMKLAQRGDIVGARVGRAWVFLEDDVVAFLRKVAKEQTTARQQGLDVDGDAPTAQDQRVIVRRLSATDKRRPGRKPRILPTLPDVVSQAA